MKGFAMAIRLQQTWRGRSWQWKYQRTRHPNRLEDVIRLKDDTGTSFSPWVATDCRSSIFVGSKALGIGSIESNLSTRSPYLSDVTQILERVGDAAFNDSRGLKSVTIPRCTRSVV
jgi:hypothetical protein